MNKEELVKIIVEEFKKEGLEVAEDVALRFAKVSLGVCKKVVVATENKADDLLLPVLSLVEGPLYKLLDKIDGHEG